MSKEIIDPRKIKDGFPFWWLSSDLRGFLGFGIKERTGSNYNHAMSQNKQGFFATQGWVYKEVPVETYMKNQLLECWECDDMTELERRDILALMYINLNASFWKRLYDAPGIFGQAIGLRNINIPWLSYCSEREESTLRIIIPKVGHHNSPGSLRKKMQESSRMRVRGYCVPYTNI